MPNGVQAAAAYLRELLLRPGRYRRRWEQYAERSRLGQVNQLAVAEVLAHYLWEHPRAQGDVDVLPRQLKDTASRALSGKLLSKATLTLFTDAFGFDAFERERLVKLWEGSAHVRVLSGPRAIREDQAKQAALVSRVASDVFNDPQMGAMALARSKIALASFSRGQELEADAVGVGYRPCRRCRPGA